LLAPAATKPKAAKKETGAGLCWTAGSHRPGCRASQGVLQEIAKGIKRGNRKLLRKAKRQLDEMIPRLQQVLRQTRQRVLHGNTRAEGKLVSLFEVETEVIRKGKTKKLNEFGKLVKIQKAENRLITDYQVLDQRPADSTLLIPSIEQHIQQFGHARDALAADPGFFSAANEAAAEKLGVKRVSIPSNGTPANSVKKSKRSGGSRNCKNVGPAAKAASASSNVHMACIDRYRKDCAESSGGSDLE
jgi:hypothetical protein